MRVFLMTFLGCLLLVGVGGGLLLLLANPKPKTEHVEKIIPRDRLGS